MRSGSLNTRLGGLVDLLSTQTVPGAKTFTGGIAVAGGLIVASSTPASAGATGTTGDIAWDSDYIYVCVATNTWKRVAIATW